MVKMTKTKRESKKAAKTKRNISSFSLQPGTKKATEKKIKEKKNTSICVLTWCWLNSVIVSRCQTTVCGFSLTWFLNNFFVCQKRFSKHFSSSIFCRFYFELSFVPKRLSLVRFRPSNKKYKAKKAKIVVRFQQMKYSLPCPQLTMRRKVNFRTHSEKNKRLFPAIHIFGWMDVVVRVFDIGTTILMASFISLMKIGLKKIACVHVKAAENNNLLDFCLRSLSFCTFCSLLRYSYFLVCFSSQSLFSRTKQLHLDAWGKKSVKWCQCKRAKKRCKWF